MINKINKDAGLWGEIRMQTGIVEIVGKEALQLQIDETMQKRSRTEQKHSRFSATTYTLNGAIRYGQVMRSYATAGWHMA